jgi:hypothetical protein
MSIPFGGAIGRFITPFRQIRLKPSRLRLPQ